MKNAQGGYDAAISSREEDLLNRWGFAHEIFTLASKCPEDWSVRIAVYGGWGTGKTSVLRFVERMALANNHVVTWFNPWGVTDSVGLWRAFIEGILGSIKEHPLGPDLGRIRFRENTRKIVGAMNGLSKLVAQAEKFVGTSLGLLDRWIKAGRDDLREISAYFKGHRIIVLVDDLDRADPKFVPEVLRALKEVLDVPGFSFVLGFDRDRVGAALAEQHPGWGNGLDFLDKIIDFPRWLPSPSDREMFLLAEQDLKQYASFVDPLVFKDVVRFMPNNPRTLRRFIRGLWSMGGEIKRYGVDEIDWGLILLLALFRAQWPIPSEKILQEEVLSELVALENRLVVRDSKEAEEKARVGLGDIIRRTGVAEEEQERACALLQEILRKTNFRATSVVLGYSFLVERPPPLTQREFEDLYGKWEDKFRPAVIEAWVSAHVARLPQSKLVVWDAVFRKSISLYHQRLGEAADATTDEQLALKVSQANSVLGLIEALSVELDGFVGDKSTYDEEHFGLLVALAGRWAHFSNHRLYPPLRGKEQQMVIDVAVRGKLDPVKVWEKIGPHGAHYEWSETGPRRVFLEKLEKVFVPRIVEAIWLLFERPHALESLLYDVGLVEKRMLYDLTSMFWSAERRPRIFEFSERAKDSVVIHENMYTLFRGMSGDIRPGDERSLVFDKEVLLSIWRGATAQRLNPRMAGSLEKMRREIEVATGYELGVPSWWKEVVPTSTS